MRVGRSYSFDMAHRLPSHSGKCNRLHGHTYTLEVEAVGPVGVGHVVIWYEELDALVKPWIENVDHFTVLQESDDVLPDGPHVVRMPYGWEPTAERLAQWLFEHLADHPMGFNLRLWETPRSWVALP